MASSSPTSTSTSTSPTAAEAEVANTTTTTMENCCADLATVIMSPVTPPPPPPPPPIHLKVVGLGYKLKAEIPPNAPLSQLKELIEEYTELLPAYQRLVCRGLKLEDDTMTLEEIGLKDRTKIILMHSPLYAKEKDTFEALMTVSTEIDDLGGQSGVESNVLTELVTRICCRLDAIDTTGSAHLRAKRKELLKKAEDIDTPKERQFD